MSGRQLLRLAAVLAGLLLLWGVVALARRESDDARGQRALGVDSSKVDSVLFANSTDTVKLVRKGMSWVVNGFPAAPEEVREMLVAVADTARGELVAENPSSHARLGVDSTKGRRVRVLDDGKPVLDVLVGVSEGGFGSAYVRRVGEAPVYRVRSRLGELAGRSPDEWRDKTIVKLPADSIGSVTIRRGTSEYALQRDSTRWRFAAGTAPADSASVANLVRDLANIRAAGFAADSQARALRFTRPDRRLTIKDSNGRALAALVFDSTASGIWVRNETAVESPIWRVESWDWDRIMPARKNLEKPKGS